MSEKQKFLLIVAFSVIALFCIVMTIDQIEKSKEMHNKSRASQERANDVAEREILLKEIDRFKACDGNAACENIFPNAKAAIEAADKKAKEEARD
ncbi:MAG: hypothetical protein EOP04_03760 [Proteobacteria bacterium]|nr:MAG: hypothetical protein EOP04_03760 [Pseudomonadota bacterium]